MSISDEIRKAAERIADSAHIVDWVAGVLEEREHRAEDPAKIHLQETKTKLEAQLDGWAALLGITKDYWIPAGQKEEYENQRRMFFVLSDYGRKNALKTSQFNQGALSYRRGLEAECDRERDAKHEWMKRAEGLQILVDSAEDGRARDRSHVERLEEALRQAKGALAQAEDFIVTHAAQGDEKLLAVIGTVLDKDLLPNKKGN